MNGQLKEAVVRAMLECSPGGQFTFREMWKELGVGEPEVTMLCENIADAAIAIVVERCAQVARERASEWESAIHKGLGRIDCNKSYAEGALDNCLSVANVIDGLVQSGMGLTFNGCIAECCRCGSKIPVSHVGNGLHVCDNVPPRPTGTEQGE